MSDDDFMLEDDEQVSVWNVLKVGIGISWRKSVTVNQDYDFEYEDDEDEEPDADLENKYYNAKGCCWERGKAGLAADHSRLYSQEGRRSWRRDCRVPKSGRRGRRKRRLVILVEITYDKWMKLMGLAHARGFKSLKQMAKISFHLNRYEDVEYLGLLTTIFTATKLTCFHQTLKYYTQLLTYTKSAVTRNYSEKSINNILDYVSTADDMTFVERFYQVSLDALAVAKNEVNPPCS